MGRGGHQPTMGGGALAKSLGGSSAKYGGGHKPTMGGASAKYGGSSTNYGGAIS